MNKIPSMKKVKQVNSGAYGVVQVGIDRTGRYTFCSAGLDLIPFLHQVQPKKLAFVKS